MIHPENLKRGMFIAITKNLKEESTPPFSDPFTFSRPREHHFDGIPLEVLAVSPPFIATENPHGQLITIDMRVWDITLLNRRYVREFLAPEPIHSLSREKAPHRRRRKRKKEKPDPRDCPRCGDRLRRRLKAGSSEWIVVCPTCDYLPPTSPFEA